MVKQKEVNNIKEIFILLKKKFIKKNKNIKKIGYSLAIKRLTAKILWFSLLLLLINIILPNLTTLFSLAFAVGFDLASSLISTFFDEKITYIITGKFFDRFSSRLLNESIFVLLAALLIKLFFYPKMIELKLFKRDEK